MAPLSLDSAELQHLLLILKDAGVRRFRYGYDDKGGDYDVEFGPEEKEPAPSPTQVVPQALRGKVVAGEDKKPVERSGYHQLFGGVMPTFDGVTH